MIPQTNKTTRAPIADTAMTAEGKKTHTAKGKPYARFTMRVVFKPEYQHVNESTGEVYEYWTYRSDLEADKLATDGIFFDHPAKALGFVYLKNRHKLHEVKFWDNALPELEQLRYWELMGKIIAPRDKVKQKKFLEWLKTIL